MQTPGGRAPQPGTASRSVARATDLPGPPVVVAPAPQPSAIRVEPVPAASGPDPAAGHGPAAVRCEQFRTTDPEAARLFFAGAYAPGWRVTGLARGSVVAHRRCEADSVTVDDVLIQGRVSCQIPPADSVVVIQPRAGSLTVQGAASPSPDCPVLVAHGMSGVLQVSGARFDVVTIATDVLHKVAADLQAPLSQQIRFLSARP
ncbi:MAG: AraC family transcriptional regulator, partial [Mycobacterium sp.]|nr:AraC family transcriptional regulator [Mycobacterium sp.]